MKIGIIRERKIPSDHRVPLTPSQCVEALSGFPQLSIKVEKSEIRCFSNQEYTDAGIEVANDLEDCDIIIGVKEIPVDALLRNRTYFFFSHTIKKQPSNRDLLRSVLQKDITLVDWECLKDQNGERVIAFGRFAGIVGAYNTIRAIGYKYDRFDIPKAIDLLGLDELFTSIANLDLPELKIVLTGGGRVSQGAMEVLSAAGIKKCTIEEYINTEGQLCYVQLDPDDYNKRRDGSPYVTSEFYSSPELFESDFKRFAVSSDVLISGAYWDPNAPRLFSKEDVGQDDFRIRVIGDITCDIDGSVPTTVRSSTIHVPFYDINRSSLIEEKDFSSKDNITVMAVDNLPCEVPRDASESFGIQFLDYILPQIFDNQNLMIENATIATKGSLTPGFEYLSDYVQ